MKGPFSEQTTYPVHIIACFLINLTFDSNIRALLHLKMVLLILMMANAVNTTRADISIQQRRLLLQPLTCNCSESTKCLKDVVTAGCSHHTPNEDPIGTTNIVRRLHQLSFSLLRLHSPFAVIRPPTFVHI